jgi:hypothetical protein
VGAKESVSDPMSFVMPNQFVLVLWVRGSNARKFQVDYESEIPRKVVRKLKVLYFWWVWWALWEWYCMWRYWKSKELK